jgi:tRNA pseudouridine38-40 synthase
MPRYFLELSYRGSAYHGWQVQPNARTVQGTLQDALSTISRTQAELTGCGRTDTGVHASLYYAHIDFPEPIQDLGKLAFQLNAVLPFDIRIRRVYPVEETAHARYDAQFRAYGYYLFRKPGPFLQGLGWPYASHLEVDQMNEAAAYCLGEHDFSSFTKTGSHTGHNRCTVSVCKWMDFGTHLKFDVGANRFLRGMVRALTGTLLNVGKGQLSTDSFLEILTLKDRSSAGESAPPEGLFLESIHYPYLPHQRIDPFTP